MRLIDWHPQGLSFSGSVKTFRVWLKLRQAHLLEHELALKEG